MHGCRWVGTGGAGGEYVFAGIGTTFQEQTLPQSKVGNMYEAILLCQTQHSNIHDDCKR